MEGEELSTVEPEKTLDFYVQARDGKKRDYIFNMTKVKTCSHPELEEIVTGGQFYRCKRCNMGQVIVTAYAMPLHHMAKLGVQQALWFAKQFGGSSLQEVLRRPSGQHELDYHLAALPEGMDIDDAIAAFDQIDVNTDDEGKQQLLEMYEELWVSPAERERRHNELGRDNKLGDLLKEHGLLAVDDEAAYAEATGRPVRGKQALRELEASTMTQEITNGTATKSEEAAGGAERAPLPPGDTVPSLPREGQDEGAEDRDTGKF